MNVVPPAVSAGHTGEKHDFLPDPVPIPCQGSESKTLVAVRFGLRLAPGADFLLYEEVNTEVEHLIDCLDTRAKLTRCLFLGQTP